MSRRLKVTALRNACSLALLLAGSRATATPAADDPSLALAAAISRLIEGAIPLEYEKQKDWGATTNVSTGWNIEGKPFHWHAHQRRRAVNHGVWKHYRLRLIEPENNLRVELTEVRPLGLGRVAFHVTIAARLDAWARAKVYQYGVHLIAVEMESDLHVKLSIDGELAISLREVDGHTAIVLAPAVRQAALAIEEFRLRRISDARGPLVRELGDGVRSLVEDELNGPQLVEKLNRAIEKKQDRLTFRPAELLEKKWWPLKEAGQESRVRDQGITQN